MGDDDEPGVVAVQELQPGELRGEPRAARALPLLAREPHVVVDDELTFALEHFHQPDRAMGSLERVVRQLHHRQAPAGRGDAVELASRHLLSGTQLGQRSFPAVLVHDRRGGNGPAPVIDIVS